MKKKRNKTNKNNIINKKINLYAFKENKEKN